MEPLRHYIRLIDSMQATDPAEYQKTALDRFEKKAPGYESAAEMSKSLVLSLYPNAKQYTEKSQSSNFIVQWIESEHEIFIVGLVTRLGKLTREDTADVYEAINKLIDKMQEGKTLITSPNMKSIRLLEKVKKIAADRGININIEIDYMGNAIGGDPNDPELQFNQVIASVV